MTVKSLSNFWVDRTDDSFVFALDPQQGAVARLIDHAFDLYTDWRLTSPEAAAEVARELGPIDPELVDVACREMLSRLARPNARKTAHIQRFFDNVSALIAGATVVTAR